MKKLTSYLLSVVLEIPWALASIVGKKYNTDKQLNWLFWNLFYSNSKSPVMKSAMGDLLVRKVLKNPYEYLYVLSHSHADVFLNISNDYWVKWLDKKILNGHKGISPVMSLNTLFLKDTYKRSSITISKEQESSLDNKVNQIRLNILNAIKSSKIFSKNVSIKNMGMFNAPEQIKATTCLLLKNKSNEYIKTYFLGLMELRAFSSNKNSIPVEMYAENPTELKEWHNLWVNNENKFLKSLKLYVENGDPGNNMLSKHDPRFYVEKISLLFLWASEHIDMNKVDKHLSSWFEEILDSASNKLTYSEEDFKTLLKAKAALEKNKLITELSKKDVNKDINIKHELKPIKTSKHVRRI